MTCSSKFSSWRADRRIGLDCLAETLGVSKGAVRKWLDGSRMPRADAIARIEQLTEGKVTAADLLRDHLAATRAPGLTRRAEDVQSRLLDAAPCRADLTP